MKRSLVMGGLMYMLAGCAAFTPSNATDSEENHRLVDLTPEYNDVVSEPLNGLLPPPKLNHLALPEGSQVSEPVKKHLDHLKEYRTYLDQSISVVEQMINEDNEETKLARQKLRGTTYNCDESPLQQIALGESPRAKPLPIGSTKKAIADAAVAYAQELKDYHNKTLRVVEEGVAKYSEECGLRL